MKYHCFSRKDDYCATREYISLFVYSDDGQSCLEYWNIGDYGIHIEKKTQAQIKRDINIENRIFILSTDQNGQLDRACWNYKELCEQEAYALLI